MQLFCPQLLVAQVSTTHWCLGRDSRALIEQIWAWLELRVRMFGLRVSVLSVYAAEKATDPGGQTFPCFCILTTCLMFYDR